MKAETKKRVQRAENWLLLAGFIYLAVWSEGAVFLYVLPWLILGALTWIGFFFWELPEKVRRWLDKK